MKCAVNKQVVLLSGAPEGPLAPYIVSFAQSLIGQRYSLSSLKRQVRIAACFSRWLKQDGIEVRNIYADHPVAHLVRPTRSRVYLGRRADWLALI